MEAAQNLPCVTCASCGGWGGKVVSYSIPPVKHGLSTIPVCRMAAVLGTQSLHIPDKCKLSVCNIAETIMSVMSDMIQRCKALILPKFNSHVMVVLESNALG